MGRYAGIALTVALTLLLVMAILVASPHLFYMSAALIAILGIARIHAWASVRWLRFERLAPPAVSVGEEVTIEMVVWSERRIKRPLVMVKDHLPGRLVGQLVSRSLPVAPSYEQPIKTRYSFRPMRRGVYTWDRLTVLATDALGIVTLTREYDTQPIELRVYPTPLPVEYDLNSMLGWGASELEMANVKGPGIEFRGVREYVSGDPMRYVDWKSSARVPGRLMVKEFDTSTGSTIQFFLQRTNGTDVGNEETSTFEAMCGHSLYLAQEYIKRSATVRFPISEGEKPEYFHTEQRTRDIRELLTREQPIVEQSLSQELAAMRGAVHAGATVIVFVAVQDEGLPELLADMPDSHRVAMLYDPTEYADPKRPFDGAPATDPAYVRKLEAAGVEVAFMPYVRSLRQ